MNEEYKGWAILPKGNKETAKIMTDYVEDQKRHISGFVSLFESSENNFVSHPLYDHNGVKVIFSLGKTHVGTQVAVRVIERDGATTAIEMPLQDLHL